MSREQVDYDILKLSNSGKGVTLSMGMLTRFVDISPNDCLLITKNPDGSACLRAFNPLKGIPQQGNERFTDTVPSTPEEKEDEPRSS